MTDQRSYGIIQGHNITYSYGHIRALQTISILIPQGKHIAVLGANGSGKSTLARHFNAILVPVEGTVKVKGMDTQDQEQIWKIRNTVGMVFQNSENQIVGATVEDDIVFGLENLGLESEDIAIRLERVVNKLQLGAIRYKEPHQLSGGQKQRVAIAGVLAMEPDVIVLDEATSMLDPDGRQEVLTALKTILEDSTKTIIQITHDIEEAILADEVYVLAEGQIVMKGVPKTIFTYDNGLPSLGLQLPFSMRFYQKFATLQSEIIETEHIPMCMEELVNQLCRYNVKT
ncbi:energy-coupling factor transporter ATPase [Desulfuribacillus alkaliarsenatis]|uniref:Energy-coupling factor transporter ATPase n=1 Tax=Desulfuribacillus alkaliarsenatis TaxID=766136 RepID=A0A1E5G5D8_9FIRM|nr:energy-coupling factor transporter ATPase [Desulfuribacillus alkaliarsenatis]OEF97909.1 energy-coupling factor transporter ATPase [Desulfuribacillus alkaliarsenatis]